MTVADQQIVKASTATTFLKLSPKELAALDEMENVIRDCDLALSDAAGKVAKAFAMAQGIGQLRDLITDQMMEVHILPLMNTRLGFKTDQDPNRPKWDKGQGRMVSPEPYPMPIVKDCIIEALLRGANPVGNEFNIISGQCYFTKEFFERKLGELPGVTNVVPSPGIPRTEQGPDGKVVKALIRFGLSWKVNGVDDCLRDADGKPGRAFEIKADNWSSSDQIIGKATRKAYAAAYRQIMGSELAPPDGDVDGAIDGTVVTSKMEPSGGAADLNAKAAQATAKKIDVVQAHPVAPETTAGKVDNVDQLQQPQKITYDEIMAKAASKRPEGMSENDAKFRLQTVMRGIAKKGGNLAAVTVWDGLTVEQQYGIDEALDAGAFPWADRK